MLESVTLIANLVYVSLLLETSLLFYFITRKLGKLSSLWKDSRSFYLLKIFSEMIDLLSSTDLLDDGIIGANFNIKSEALQKFLDNEVKGVGSKIKLLNNYISSMENIDSYVSGISSNVKEIFYIVLASIIFFALYFLPLFSFNGLFLGFSLGLDIISMYYIIYSFLVYRDMMKKIMEIRNSKS
ncbi:hypothetical protein [Acidianus sp. HS-5]|uniref:hypothetical protein n=1 Tax=Acidianus sp. HS-5 TaxID=2886040 RepID=UPI001F23FF80|nr:hypothetical protein [Acidianus sp. HS-5]BDC17160.1 hypothetical protein HS5_00500 [Acidianus sp. HS-5]